MINTNTIAARFRDKNHRATWPRRLLPWAVACAGFGVGGFALAQAPGRTITLPPDVVVSEESARSSLLPQVFAQDLRVTVGTGNAVRGSFIANNTGAETVGDLQVEVLVLGPLPPQKEGELLPDNAPVYDRAIQEGTFALSPKSTKEIPVAYTVLPLPEGTYRFRVQLRSSNDRELGWATVPVTLTGSKAFAVVETTQIETESTDLATNAPRSIWDPLEGVNVNPGQALTLVSSVRNAGSEPLTATAVLTTKRLLTQNETPTTVTGETVTLAPGQGAQPLPFSLSALQKPGSYQAIVSLRDAEGKRVSGLAEYRYVVLGPSASVVSATFEDFKTKKGEIAVVRFTVVGAADRITDLEASAEVTVLDGTEPAGTTQAPVRFRDPSAVPGTARVLLDRDLEAPGIRVVLRGTAGDVLDVYETSFPDVSPAITPEGANGVTPSLLLTIAVTILALTALFVILGWQQWRGGRRPKSGRRIATTTLALLIAGGVGGALLRSTGAQASGIQFKITYGTQSSVDLWVNQPLHLGTAETITLPYEARLQWYTCANGSNMGAIVVYTRNTGGWIESRTRTPANQWSGQTVTFTHVPNEEPPFSTLMGEPAYAVNPAPHWTQQAQHREDYTETNSGEFFNRSFIFTANLTLPFKYTHTIWTAAQSYSNGIASGAVIDDFTWLHTKNNASCGGITTLNSVTAGQTFPASVTMNNTGTRLWETDPTPHRLGAHPQDENPPRWKADRLPLPSSPILPGSSARFDFTATAPTTPGVYSFNWRMLEELIEWFGPAPTCAKTIIVTPAPSLPDLVTQQLNVSTPRTVGALLTLSGNVVNSGRAAAGTTSSTQFKIDGVQIGTTQTGVLNAGASESESNRWTATAGSHVFELCADRLNQVLEANEGNNCSALAFDVSDTVPPPPPPPPGSTACSPLAQTVLVNQPALFTASGGDGSYVWTAAGGVPASGSGTTFSTSYGTTGTKAVTASSAGVSAICRVEVTDTPPPTPTPTPQLPPPSFQERQP